MSERDSEKTIKLDVGDIHIVISFLKEDNLDWKDEVLRVLMNKAQIIEKQNQ